MPVNQQLLAAIQATLGPAITPSLTQASAGDDLYEAYVLSIVVDAAREEGATVTFHNISGAAVGVFTFRTSPGYIHSDTQDYTYARFEFANAPTLEAHVGIRVSGRSTVLHEADVAVVKQSEAVACRQNEINPRSHELVVAVECKFYGANIPLGMARGFLGLVSDFSAKEAYFVTNMAGQNATRLLAYRAKHWEIGVQPSAPTTVLRLRNAFQKALRNHIDRS